MKFKNFTIEQLLQAISVFNPLAGDMDHVNTAIYEEAMSEFRRRVGVSGGCNGHVACDDPQRSKRKIDIKDAI